MKAVRITNKKTMIKMKSNFKTYVLAILASLIGVNTYAQNFNVESVKMELMSQKDDTEKDLESCLKWITEAAEHPKTANDPKMWYYKGLTYLKIANANSELTKANPEALDIALESFNNSLKTDVKGKYTAEAEASLLNVAIGMYYKGYAAFQAEEYSTAFTDFQKVLPLLKYDKDGHLKRNNLTSDAVEQLMAFSALGMGDKSKAKKSFQSLVDKGTSDPNTYINLSKLYLEDGDTTKALDIVTQGKELNETDKGLINMELDIYLKQGRSKELITKLDKAIADDPGNTIYYFARAISYEGLKELELAEADYDKILEIDPSYFDAAYNKGVMYLNKVAALVDEMNEKNIYKPSEIAKYESQINALYVKGIVQFENVFENNAEMAENDKFELAQTMKKIYAQLQRMDKYNVMKDYIDANTK
jgi:tetratricopeptide (TPR) repeat protein